MNNCTNCNKEIKGMGLVQLTAKKKHRNLCMKCVKKIYPYPKIDEIRASRDSTKPTYEEEITVREALAWSDKHRKLSNGEGVRVVHVKQLLERALSSQRDYYKGEVEKMEGQGVKTYINIGNPELDGIFYDEFIPKKEVLSLLSKK